MPAAGPEAEITHAAARRWTRSPPPLSWNHGDATVVFDIAPRATRALLPRNRMSATEPAKPHRPAPRPFPRGRARLWRASALSSLAASQLVANTVAGPQFTALPDLPGGATSSEVTGLSGNGLWAVGMSPSTNGNEAVRWSIANTTALGLGDIPQSPFSSAAVDVSNDGFKAAARGTISVGGIRAMRWVGSPTVTLTNLNTLTPFTGFQYSDAKAISDDGTKVVGVSYKTTNNNPSQTGLRAFLWNSASPFVMTDLGYIVPSPLPTGGDLLSFSSEANDISADGLHIIGTSSYLLQKSVVDTNPNDSYVPPPTFVSSGSVGFVRQNTSLVQLSDLTGGAMAAAAYAISDNKTRIVGTGTSGSGAEGVIWSVGNPNPITVTSVGDLPGGDVNCQLLAVNSDGSRTAGRGTDDTGTTAVIWTQALGLRKLATVMQDLGIAPTGWSFREVTGMSSDGKVLVGNGTNPSGQNQAWVITNADSLFLSLPPLPAVSIFSASPATITPGGFSTLSWTVTNATSVIIDGGVGTVAASGSSSVTPAATQTYTLTATDSIGRQVTATATVTLNNPPVFAGYSGTTGFETPLSIPAATLLAVTTDPDNDSFTLTAAGPTSSNVGTAVLQDGSILYTPPAGFSGTDTFPITITDARNAVTNSLVLVTVDFDPAMESTSPVMTVLPDGRTKLEFQGIAGRSYQVQRSTTLLNWTVLETLVASQSGTLSYIDENPPAGAAFYRFRRP